MANNFMVAKCRKITGMPQRWEVLDQRHGASATVWVRRDYCANYFRTAREARAYCESVQGGAITAWTRHAGRGSAYYTAQSYTGLILDGVALARETANPSSTYT